MKRIAATFLVTLILTVGCATNPGPGSVTDDDGPVDEGAGQRREDELAFPHYIADAIAPGDDVPALHSGVLLGFEPDERGALRAVVEVTQPYYLYGEERSLSYALVYGGITEEVAEPGPVAQNETLGVAGDSVYLTSRYPALHPWLIRTSTQALYHGEFWWYLPQWIDPSFTQFLSFRQIDSLFDLSETLLSTYVTDDAGDILIQYLHDRDRVRVPLPLDEYPVPVNRTPAVMAAERQFYGGTGAIAFEQSVGMVDGFEIMLYWQQDFDHYLRDEYVLGDPLWVYCSIYVIDNAEKQVIVFARDFSVTSDEELIAEQTVLLQARREEGE